MKPLPLAGEVAAPEMSPLSGEIQVFDPAMCCPTGVCGPGVDPALLTVARDLRWLVSRGATVARFGLAQEPRAFAANPLVSGLLQTHGDAALPATLVNGEILVRGRYPTRDELVAALTHGATPGSGATEGCCGPDSNCC